MEIYGKIPLSLLLVLSINFCLGEKITIVHWNDISGQLGPYTPLSHTGSPLPHPCSGENCVGGLGNLQYHIDKLVNESTTSANTFKLTSGNLVGGENGWLAYVGWNNSGKLVHEYTRPFAMSVGMKEFGGGLPRTLEFLNNIPNTKIVLSNVNCGVGGKPEVDFCGKIVEVTPLIPSVGLLGFMNTDVELLSSPGSLAFKDIVTSLKEVISKNKQYKSFIAIGDGSLEISKKILDAIPEIQLVIYGRGFGSSKEMKDYPEPYSKRYIATAGKYGSTVGKLVLDFDANGKIVSTVGSALTIPSGLHMNDEVTKYSVMVAKDEETKIGQTLFKLEGGDRCWRQECNLGNLVADAMAHCALTTNTSAIPAEHPVVALWHGGALVDDEVKPKSLISKIDIHKWLPFHNRAHFVKITGANLWKVFEKSASGITANNVADVKDWGQFLQVSNGLEIYYSTKGKAPVLEKIRILHEEDSTPIMKDIDLKMDYYIVIPSFIKEGRNLYKFAKDFWQPIGSTTDIGFDDVCLESYITALNKISIGFEERIWINAKDLYCSNGSKGASTTVTVILTIVFMVVILGIVFIGYFYVFPKLTGRHPAGFRTFSDHTNNI